jgi:hypothetical protein
LHSDKGVKVTGTDEHGDKHIPRNETVLIGGAAGRQMPPPAAVAKHIKMSQNQNQL